MTMDGMHLDAGTDVGTVDLPRCPSNDEYTWPRGGGESCWLDPLCGPTLMQGVDHFDCCYIVRQSCSL
ncbi:MAG: hypothetical protein JWN04_6589 [Myxococcaceae bacterium]|nr:hypothetical protein [Myxococcaceae bacterium]